MDFDLLLQKKPEGHLPEVVFHEACIGFAYIRLGDVYNIRRHIGKLIFFQTFNEQILFLNPELDLFELLYFYNIIEDTFGVIFLHPSLRDALVTNLGCGLGS